MFVAACGSSNSSSSSGGGGGGASTGEKVSGAKVIDPNSMNNPPKGTIKYCQGKDTTGAAKAIVKDFNAKYGAQGYKATLTEFPASADQQRAQFIQRQQAKSDDCDVFSSDVIWTAEFASQKWLYDLTPVRQQAQKSKYIAAPLETVHYGGKYWGVPETSDAAFIYYRTDKGGGTPPATWQQVYADAAKQGGIVYQGAPYEGLTCDFLELAFAAGGTGPQRRRQEVDDQLAAEHQGAAAHGRRHQGRRRRPRPSRPTWSPRPTRRGPAASTRYMRNWTYAYAADNKGPSKVAGKYKVAPLPSFEGGGKAGILGGHNSVISVYTKNPGLALKFADFYASPAFQKKLLLKYSQAAVIPGTYSEAGRQEGDPVRAGAPAGAQPGQGPAGVAGVSADLAGDLQERQRRARRSREPGRTR